MAHLTLLFNSPEDLGAHDEPGPSRNKLRRGPLGEQSISSGNAKRHGREGAAPEHFLDHACCKGQILNIVEAWSAPCSLAFGNITTRPEDRIYL